MSRTDIDIDDAAAGHRTCRRAVTTVRRPIDCRIAAAAIRADVPVRRADADFAALARHISLRAHLASPP